MREKSCVEGGGRKRGGAKQKGSADGWASQPTCGRPEVQGASRGWRGLMAPAKWTAWTRLVPLV